MFNQQFSSSSLMKRIYKGNSLKEDSLKENFQRKFSSGEPLKGHIIRKSLSVSPMGVKRIHTLNSRLDNSQGELSSVPSSYLTLQKCPNSNKKKFYNQFLFYRLLFSSQTIESLNGTLIKFNLLDTTTFDVKSQHNPKIQNHVLKKLLESKFQNQHSFLLNKTVNELKLTNQETNKALKRKNSLLTLKEFFPYRKSFFCYWLLPFVGFVYTLSYTQSHIIRSENWVNKERPQEIHIQPKIVKLNPQNNVFNKNESLSFTNSYLLHKSFLTKSYPLTGSVYNYEFQKESKTVSNNYYTNSYNSFIKNPVQKYCAFYISSLSAYLNNQTASDGSLDARRANLWRDLSFVPGSISSSVLLTGPSALAYPYPLTKVGDSQTKSLYDNLVSKIDKANFTINISNKFQKTFSGNFKTSSSVPALVLSLAEENLLMASDSEPSINLESVFKQELSHERMKSFHAKALLFPNSFESIYGYKQKNFKFILKGSKLNDVNSTKYNPINSYTHSSILLDNFVKKQFLESNNVLNISNYLNLQNFDLYDKFLTEEDLLRKSSFKRLEQNLYTNFVLGRDALKTENINVTLSALLNPLKDHFVDQTSPLVLSSTSSNQKRNYTKLSKDQLYKILFSSLKNVQTTELKPNKTYEVNFTTMLSSKNFLTDTLFTDLNNDNEKNINNISKIDKVNLTEGVLKDSQKSFEFIAQGNSIQKFNRFPQFSGFNNIFNLSHPILMSREIEPVPLKEDLKKIYKVYANAESLGLPGGNLLPRESSSVSPTGVKAPFPAKLKNKISQDDTTPSIKLQKTMNFMVNEFHHKKSDLVRLSIDNSHSQSSSAPLTKSPKVESVRLQKFDYKFSNLELKQNDYFNFSTFLNSYLLNVKDYLIQTRLKNIEYQPTKPISSTIPLVGGADVKNSRSEFSSAQNSFSSKRLDLRASKVKELFITGKIEKILRAYFSNKNAFAGFKASLTETNSQYSRDKNVILKNRKDKLITNRGNTYLKRLNQKILQKLIQQTFTSRTLRKGGVDRNLQLTLTKLKRIYEINTLKLFTTDGSFGNKRSLVLTPGRWTSGMSSGYLTVNRNIFSKFLQIPIKPIRNNTNRGSIKNRKTNINQIKSPYYTPRLLVQNRLFITDIRTKKSIQTKTPKDFGKLNRFKYLSNYVYDSYNIFNTISYNLSTPSSTLEISDRPLRNSQNGLSPSLFPSSESSKGPEGESKSIRTKKSFQKKRRIKKLKKETRQRKKRKRFYPRPLWIRYRLYSNYLKNRYFKLTRTNNELSKSIGVQVTEKNLRSKFSPLVLSKGSSALTTKDSFLGNSLLYPLKSYSSISSKAPPAALPPGPSVSKFQTLSSNETSNFYTISRPVVGELKRVLWKSYWLRSNLNPYLTNVRSCLKNVKQSRQSWELYTNLKFFILQFFGFTTHSEQNFNSVIYQNNIISKINEVNIPLNHYKLETATNFAEYNRNSYERLQQFISQIRENLTLNGNIKVRASHTGYLPFREKRGITVQKSDDFWVKVGKTLTFENHQSSVSKSLSKLRLYWAYSKTSYGFFKEQTSRKQHWASTKQREQTKNNKTKKLYRNIMSQMEILLKQHFPNVPEYLIPNIFPNIAVTEAKGMGEQNQLRIRPVRESSFREFPLEILAGSSEENMNRNSNDYSGDEYINFKANINKLLKKALQKSRKKEEKSSMFFSNNIKFKTDYNIEFISNNSKQNKEFLKLNSLNLQIRKMDVINKIENYHDPQLGNSNNKDLHFYHRLSFNKDSIKNHLTTKSAYWWTEEFQTPNLRTDDNISKINGVFIPFMTMNEDKMKNIHFITMKQFILTDNQYNSIFIISSLLFHFCTVLSILSISQVRGFMKFGFLALSKLYKTSIGIILNLTPTFVLNKPNNITQNKLTIDSIINSKLTNLSQLNKLSKDTSVLELTSLPPKQNLTNRNRNFLVLNELILHKKYHLNSNELNNIYEVNFTTGNQFKLMKQQLSFDNLTSIPELRNLTKLNLHYLSQVKKDNNKGLANYNLTTFEYFKYFKFIYNVNNLFRSQLQFKRKSSPNQNSEGNLLSAPVSEATARMNATSGNPLLKNLNEFNKKMYLLLRYFIKKPIYIYKVNLTKTSLPLTSNVKSNASINKIKNVDNQHSLTKYWSSKASLSSLLTIQYLTQHYYNIYGKSSSLVKEVRVNIIEKGFRSIYAFLEKPGEQIVDWVAYMFLVEWASDISNTIPENLDIYLGSTTSKLTRILFFETLNFKLGLTNILFPNSFMLNSQISSSIIPTISPSGNSFSIFNNPINGISDIFTGNIPTYFNTRQSVFQPSNSFNFSLFNLAGPFIQRRINHLYEILLVQFYQPDTDLIVRQKKGILFWDIWGDFLMQTAEDSNINISELTSVKEEQIKLLEKCDQYFIENEKSFGFNKLLKLSSSSDSLPKSSGQNSINSNILFPLLSESLNKKTTKYYDQTLFQKHLTLQKMNEVENSLKTPSANLNLSISSQTKNKQKKDNPFTHEKITFSIEILQNDREKLSFTHLKHGDLGDSRLGWGAQQYLSYQGKDTELFIDLHPRASLDMVSLLKSNESVQQPIGTLVCQIYSGLLTKQISKNILVVGSSGNEKTLLVQAIAGETELKIITDNAYRYAMVYRGVAVGIKLLRDVFDSLVATGPPCLFLIEDIHAIGEKRPLLISDDENLSKKDSSSQEIHEKNQVFYQLSKHVITHYKKPYKGDFSLLIPTNHFSFDLFLAGLNPSNGELNQINNNKPSKSGQTTFTKKNTVSPKISTQKENQLDGSPSPVQFSTSASSGNSMTNGTKAYKKFPSKLLIKSSELLSPPASSPFSFLTLVDSKKFKPLKTVSEMPWAGLPGEQLAQVSKASYSIRVKVALLADMAISSLSVKLDMITDLLVIIDSVKGNRGFVVFATTHVPYILDPALRRPGRLDETISLGLVPTLFSRWEILKSSFSFLNPSINPTLPGISLRNTLDFSYITSNLSNQSNILQIQSKILNFISSGPFMYDDKLNSLKILSGNKRTISTIFNNQPFTSSLVPGIKKFISHEFTSTKPLAENPEGAARHFNSRLSNSKYKSVFDKTSRKILSQSYFSASILLMTNFSYSNGNQTFNNSSQIRLSKISKGNFTRILQTQIGQNHQNRVKLLKKQQQFIELTPNFFNENSRVINLYSSPQEFQNHLIYLMSGKLGEMFLFSKTSQLKDLKQSLPFLKTTAEGPLENSLREFSSASSRNGVYSSVGLSNTWQSLTTLVFSYIHKRYIYNKNLIVPKLLNFSNYSSLMEYPSPPATNILLPAKRYENYKRSFSFFAVKRKTSINIMDKINLHQQQRLVKRLYRYPVQDLFNSELIENRFTSFTNASLMIGSYDSILQNPSSSNWFVKNRIFARHKNYLTNQWWNGQLQEHNNETTFLSDIDWRYTFISPSQNINSNNSLDKFFVDKMLNASGDKSLLELNRIPEGNSLTVSPTGIKGKTTSANLLAYQNLSQAKDIVLDFPDADQHYNPRNRRWMLTKGSYSNWFDFEKTLNSQIYSHFIFGSFVKAYNIFEENREVLDFYSYYILKNPTAAQRTETALKLSQRLFM